MNAFLGGSSMEFCGIHLWANEPRMSSRLFPLFVADSYTLNKLVYNKYVYELDGYTKAQLKQSFTLDDNCGITKVCKGQ